MKPKRIPRPVRCPTLVAMHLAPEVELAERMALQAFLGGWADEAQFNVMADCRDLLALAAYAKDVKDILAVCDLAYVALISIKDRYADKRRMGASGDEMQALRVLIDVSGDFWRRQSGELFRAAHAALERDRNKAIAEPPCR